MKSILRALIFVAIAVGLRATPNDIIITQNNATTGTAQIQTVIPGAASQVLGTDANAKATFVTASSPAIIGIFASPPPTGNQTPNTGAFTTLFQAPPAYNGGLLMGNTVTAPYNQLYDLSNANVGLLSGGYFNSSLQRVASSTTPAEIQLYNGSLFFYANTGATAGSVYSATLVATLGPTSLTLGSGVGLSVPGTSTLTSAVTIGGGGTSGADLLFSGTTAAAPVGSIHEDAANGLTLIGYGSGPTTYDMMLGNGSGASWLRNAHGTQNAEAVGNLTVDGTSTLTGEMNANALVNQFGNNATSSVAVGISQNSPTTAANAAALHIGHGDASTTNQDSYIYLQSGNGSGGARTWDEHVSGSGAYFEIADSAGTGAGLKINYSGSVGVQFYGYGAGTVFSDASGNLTAKAAGAANQSITPATSALTESAGATTINWALSNSFSLTLNANLTSVTLSNLAQGQTITVAFTNTASNYTVTWGNSIKWSGGSQPVQTTGAVTDVWTITDIGGTLYGSVVQNMH